MRMRFRGVPLIVMVAANLISCHSSTPTTAAPQPEAQQVISNSLKNLYMEASAAAPQSAEQHKLLVRMAEKASNGKELLLVMRAAEGVFPRRDGSQEVRAEAQIRSKVTAKMIQFATLNQLTEYTKQYPVEPMNARMYIERMFRLAEGETDPRVWRQIRGAASRLKLADLEQQAGAKADWLARQ
jgi:hypothetical protein